MSAEVGSDAHTATAAVLPTGVGPAEAQDVPTNHHRSHRSETNVFPLHRDLATPEPGSLADHAAALRAKRLEAADPIGKEAQHAKGKLTARERINVLLDEGTFNEIGSFRRHRASGFGLERRRPYTDGVITGWGRIEGRKVLVYVHDFRHFGGSLGEAHASKIHQIMDFALSVGAPLIGLNDGAGARIQEGIIALAGYGGIFVRNVRASGVIPQISVMLGPCAGGASYSPALTDFVFMVKGTSNMFLTGPDVVRSVTGEQVTHEELGGAAAHAAKSGVAHFVFDDEISCLRGVRSLVSVLPSNNTEQPPLLPTSDDTDRSCPRLLDIVPADSRKSYDMRAVIREIVDDHAFTEVHKDWARNIICVFARFGGSVVGIVGNQPRVKAGALDIRASEKAARFVRTCDAFNIPVVSLVDVPGFLPGLDQEHRGAIRHGAKLLFAYCEATVPRIQVILRKAYGGAYIVMDSPSIGADLSLAWPSNEIGVMGAGAAVDVIYRRELAGASERDKMHSRLVSDYRNELLHPYYSAENGMVDEIIDPVETRRAIVHGLEMLRSKKQTQPTRKHANQPV